MRMYDLIEKKKYGHSLNELEIQFIVQGFTEGLIPDYQMSALLMAIYFQGMNKEETLALTIAMAKSGEMLDLSAINGYKVDKHSTGGVGDKTTLVLGPMIAACGVPVAKMSGRGLGHTGGTIDKLEAIPGFNTSISNERFIENVNQIKIAIAGQTGNLAPADKKIYALRDVTATVDNMSLIASSIMSKKIASGSNGIVLDVKTGSGAFMKTIDEAIQLAQSMVDIGTGFGRDTCAIITEMDQPLGSAIGNANEVIEAIQTLQGNGPDDLLELCYALGCQMLLLSKIADTEENALIMLEKTIEDGTALHKLIELVEAQGGDSSFIKNTELFPKADFVIPVNALKSGYIYHIDTEELGLAAMTLGGGRQKKEDVIDMRVGLEIVNKVGDYVEMGTLLVNLYGNDLNKIEEAKERIFNAYHIQDEKVETPLLIKAIVNKERVVRFV